MRSRKQAEHRRICDHQPSYMLAGRWHYYGTAESCWRYVWAFSGFSGDVFDAKKHTHTEKIGPTNNCVGQAYERATCLPSRSPIIRLCLSIYLYACHSILFVCIFICLNVWLSVWHSILLAVLLSYLLSVLLSVCLPICLYVCLSVCLTICMSIRLSVFLFVSLRRDRLAKITNRHTIYIYIYIYMCVCVYVCMCMCGYMCVCVCV